MPRYVLLLILPSLLLTACGQSSYPVPNATTPVTTTPGTPTQQALPGIFRIDFSGIGTDTPTSRIQSFQSGALSTQGLISAPEQFSFSQVSVQTLTVVATGIRHVRVTYKVTNTSSQTLRNPKFVAAVPQGSTTDSVFTNVRYFDGSDASAAVSRLSLVQGQSFDASTGNVDADPKANALLTGLDVSQVDIAGKGIKTLTQTGWWVVTPPVVSGGITLMVPGDSTLITFGVNMPMTSAANGGVNKDPFSFSLNVTPVQDAPPVVRPVTPITPTLLSSAVKQWDAASETFSNYVKFPTRTYTQNGTAITRSLPAYYDINPVDGSMTAKVLCGGDVNMSVTNISTASFPNRWRVQLFSSGEHTLNVFEGTTCPVEGTPLLSQAVTGIGTSETSIAAGVSHSVALKADGTVQTWGRNEYGQLGDGTNIYRMTPITVDGLSGITSIAAGRNFSLALRADGTVQSWGSNQNGERGDGTTPDLRYPGPSKPVTVIGLSDIVSISAGGRHSLALKADGTVQSWGNNEYGQLGDGSPNQQRNLPRAVSGLSGIASIAAGGRHSLALKADGTVLSWGDNFYGQLGDGTATERLLPGPVSGLSGIISLATSDDHNLALNVDGTVQSWGNNLYGQLGDGTVTQRSTLPVTVRGVGGITSIATGMDHSLALRADGTVLSWGRNLRGQLGDGTTTNRILPGPVSGLSGITSLAAGDNHNLALKADGTVQSWGENGSGQLGDGTTTSRTSPGPVSGLNGVAQPTP